jgi:predicted nuclease of predicted toxin-antitoxin system
MRFLLDEHIDPEVGKLLASAGHEARMVAVERPAARDFQILATALESDSVVVTFDRDFGPLVFQDAQPHAGVLFLRLRSKRPVAVATRVLAATMRLHVSPRPFLVVTDSEIREGRP